MIDKIRKRMKFERMDLFGTAYLGQLLPEALAHMPYAIVIGVRMSEAVVDQITTGPTHIYFHNYRTANAVLDRCTFLIVSMLMDLQDRENVNLPLYEQQLREADTAIQNLLNAIQQGIFTRSTKERLDELEASRDELENKIAVEKLAKPRITEEQLRFFLERFRKMDVTRKSQRKMLIDTFVNAIFLYDDKMVLTYNFHESTETITFGELQEVLPNGFRGSDMNLATEPETCVRS